MSKINVQQWEQARAQAYATRANASIFEGVEGVERFDPLVDPSLRQTSADQELRRFAYALLGVLDQQEPWSPLTFTAGWADLSNTYSPAGSFRDALGLIHLRGVVVRTSGVSVTIGTLPVAHRPATIKIFSVVSNNVFARVDVQPDGPVVLTGGSPGTFVSLDGIAYDTRG